ncbi:hypothetical protein J437_LFUL019373, partial [Ladona fulva]
MEATPTPAATNEVMPTPVSPTTNALAAMLLAGVSAYSTNTSPFSFESYIPLAGYRTSAAGRSRQRGRNRNVKLRMRNRARCCFASVRHRAKILSDHGTQFTGSLWRRELTELGVGIVFSSVRHPQSNPSERVMRELSRVFRTYCSEKHTEWLKLIPWINVWFNEVAHESTGITPTEVHFGRKPNRCDDEHVQPAGCAAMPHDHIIRLAAENLVKAGRA